METTQIVHYTSLKDYASKHNMDWRTVKKLVVDGKILLFLFRGKKIFIDFTEFQRVLYYKLVNDKKELS